VAVATHFALPQRLARGEWLEPRDYSNSWDQFGLAQAALLLDARDYDACRKLLNALLASAYTVGFIGRAVPLEAVLSVCEWGAGERASAFAAVNRGLLLTRKVGFTRFAFDEAPGLAEVIMAAAAARRLQHPLPAGFFEKFQDFFADVVTVAGPRSVPHEPLTMREIEILVLLAQGLNNQQISSRSQIALSTTKWHLKNLFAKLGVNTRTGALARARDLRLIS
jgi:LuxR family maltose regulon positive regulatory protein